MKFFDFLFKICVLSFFPRLFKVVLGIFFYIGGGGVGHIFLF